MASTGGVDELKLVLDQERLVRVVANAQNPAGFAYPALVQVVARIAGTEVPVDEGVCGELADFCWSGDLFVQRPLEVVVRFHYVAATALLNVAYMTAGHGEVVAMSNTRQVQQVYPAGKIRLLTVTNTADLTSLNIVPPLKTIWLFQELEFMHDDTASRVLTVGWYDGVNFISHNTFTGVGPDYAPFNAQVGNVPTWLMMATHDIFPRVQISALTAGKHILCQAIYQEFGGGT